MIHQCNLCEQNFEDDELITVRKERHEDWHKHCKIQKRNTVEGIVMWEVTE